MVDEMSEGDISKEDYIWKNKNVVDFYRWLAFRNRKYSQERYLNEKAIEEVKNNQNSFPT